MTRKRVKRELAPLDLFDLVPGIIGERKYCPWALESMIRQAQDRERIDVRMQHETVNRKGEPQSVELRLAVMGILQYPEGWHVSLLLYNERIDGFGYEVQFQDLHGAVCREWHRHIWNRTTQHADGKIAAGLFGKKDVTFRNFLIRTFKLMNIAYPRDVDNEQRPLF